MKLILLRDSCTAHKSLQRYDSNPSPRWCKWEIRTLKPPGTWKHPRSSQNVRRKRAISPAKSPARVLMAGWIPCQAEPHAAFQTDAEIAFCSALRSQESLVSIKRNGTRLPCFPWWLLLLRKIPPNTAWSFSSAAWRSWPWSCRRPAQLSTHSLA